MAEESRCKICRDAQARRRQAQEHPHAAEFQSVLEKEQQAPKKVRYPRNTDLDPQLVWRGKDEQDWSDLVVHPPPLYIQEKVQPRVLDRRFVTRHEGA